MALAGNGYSLFDFDGPCPLEVANGVLAERHYLGPVRRGRAWMDEFGVAVLSCPPTARNLPQDWWELTRWCLFGIKNGGSRQWSRVRRWLAEADPLATTVVSYSDPSAGHTGSLYRACGWEWHPTWHRIAPPPTGNGSWTDGKPQSVKDRWIYPLRDDDRRAGVLALDDAYRERRAAYGKGGKKLLDSRG